MQTTRHKIFLSLAAGALVVLTALLVNAVTMPVYDRSTFIRLLVGNMVGGLVAVLSMLAIQLKSEGVYYRFAMERAAIVADLNHHVRNAVFPLCLAVQRGGDVEANRMANEAVERINLALRDAMSDAFARNVDYGPSPVTPVRSRSKDAAA